jgi:uncharacterized Zn finger protein
MEESKYLCPQCGKETMVKKTTKPGWHILECQTCGTQRGPFRDRREIDVA